MTLCYPFNQLNMCSNTNYVHLCLNQGQLRGLQATDIDGGIYYSFKSIPYARPPLGNLRFKAPEPPLPWSGILDATKDGPPCLSKDLFSKAFVGSEDCLTLNVYTPKAYNEDDRLLPVMFWIHGGGFTCGSSSSEFYGPEFLITAGLVLVTINYRLGVLGFLSLEDPILNVPGNAAFKDMVMALKWVKNNIRQFSGNPDNVTIFGESAGGAAVHLLMLSPTARGLFHKAIAQSGCALNPWARGRPFAKELCNILKIEETDEIVVLEYLQNLPVEKLQEVQDQMPYYLDPDKIGLYGFLIEPGVAQEPAFLSKEPIDLILAGDFMDIPFLLGFTKDEGMVVETYKPVRYQNMTNDFECNVPYLLGYSNKSAESQAVAARIRQFYFSGVNNTLDHSRALYQMVTDNLFLYGMYVAARKHALKSVSSVYFYRMSMETSLRYLSAIMKDPTQGAAHGDDVAYLFKSRFTCRLTADTLEYFAMKRFIKLWTNFSRYGNPTPHSEQELKSIWTPVTREQVNFLDIGLELNLDCASITPNIKFWDEIYSRSPMGSKYV